MDKPSLYLTARQNRIRRIRGWIGGWFLARIANVAILAVFAIFVFIAWKSVPFLMDGNPVTRIVEMFSSTHWFPERAEPEFGMLAMIYGSAVVTLGAMLIAIPTGVLAAVVLSDMVPFRVRQWIKPVMELLAAIPSVAFGFFAIKVVAPWLQSTFGFPSGTNALGASMMLAIMAVPTIVSVAEDALTGLGRELREASYALGATRFETIVNVVLPAAHGGILAAVVLGTMRAIGETMVVWMAAGNASNFPTPWYDISAVLGSLGEAVRTMTATIAADMGETSAESIHRSALFAVGLVLLLFTCLMNMLTERLVRGLKRDAVDAEREKRGWFGIRFTIRKFCRAMLLPLRGAVRAYDEIVHGAIRLVGPALHLRFRALANTAFTGAGFLAVAALGAVLILVLGPLLGQGREAVVFRETVEHRVFLLNRFGRGDAEQVRAEFAACAEARKSVYETLDHYAWLAPEPFVEQAAKRDRATRDRNEETLGKLRHALEVEPSETAKPDRERELREAEERCKEIDAASRRLNRAFAALCGAEDRETLEQRFERLAGIAAGARLDGTAAERTVEMAQKYYAAARTADLTLRNAPTPGDPDKTHGEAFRELRDRILGTDGNGGLLGPKEREGNEHLPPELRYGAAHWTMALKYAAALRHTVVWKPQRDPNGNVLGNVAAEIKRNELFTAPDFAGLRGMLDRIDADLPAMMRPRWTFYWGYFLDTATAGRFLGGVGPELLGTLLVAFFTILFALPVGVATAAYLVETAKEGFLIRLIRLGIDTLAGVPSIVFGLFGLAFIVQYLTGRPCILAGSLTLALLVLPVMIRSAEEAIRGVPRTFREASLGLGASPTRCFFTVTLPAALPGILTGTILAMSRAAGETAPLLFTCAVAVGGLSGQVNPLWEPTPVLSYSAYDIAVGDRIAEMVPYNQFGLVATLILLVLLLNLVAIVLRGRIARRLRGG